MNPRELSHHVETSLEMAEGIIDLHTHANDFYETYARFLERLRDRADEELTKANAMLELSRLQEAHHEPEYRF